MNCSSNVCVGLADLVRPDLETDQCVGAEGVGDRDVGRIAPLTVIHYLCVNGPIIGTLESRASFLNL